MKNLILLAALVAASFSAFAQVSVNGDRNFIGAVNMSGATSTRPLREVSSAPSGACGINNELVSLQGSASLYKCVLATWTLVSGGGGGSLGIQSGGTDQTTRAKLNFTASSGVSMPCSDDAGNNRTNCTPTADTSVLLTRATAASGVDTTCIPASASGTAYTCSPATVGGSALTAFTNMGELRFRPDVPCGATPTLNVSGLGAKRLYGQDGTTSLACLANVTYILIYDTSLNAAAGGWELSGTISSGGAAVPDTTFATATTLRDDFCGGDAARVLSLGTVFGLLGWKALALGTTTGVSAGFIGSSVAPCGFSWNTATVSGGGAVFSTNQDAGANTGGDPFVNPSNQTGWRLTFPVRFASVTNVAASAGLGKTRASGNPNSCLDGTTPNDCVAVMADTSLGTTFRFRSCNGGTCTTSDMGATFSTASNYLVAITSTATGQVTATVNGGSSTTISTNVPNIITGPTFAAISRSTTSVNVLFYGVGFVGSAGLTFP